MHNIECMFAFACVHVRMRMRVRLEYLRVRSLREWRQSGR
jgi:hypothetical protein